MPIETIEHEFKEKVCDKVRLTSEGIDRYRVFTPFRFEDGDHLAIVLKREQAEWILSDEGHTLMHLTYDVDQKDLQRGTRRRIIDNALSAFSVDDRDGELILTVPGERYGDALYSYVQALLKITDISFLTRERVPSKTIPGDLHRVAQQLETLCENLLMLADEIHKEKGPRPNDQ